MKTSFLSFRAFTLLEVMLVIGILSISIASVTVWTLSTLKRTELITTSETMVSIFRKTESAARNGVNGLSHGVKIATDQLSTFEGLSFDTSDPASRSNFSLPASFTIQNMLLQGGGSEIVFSFSTGETAQSGSFLIKNSETEEFVTITVSPLGLIDWL